MRESLIETAQYFPPQRRCHRALPVLMLYVVTVGVALLINR
jgi:hypothetical protein